MAKALNLKIKDEIYNLLQDATKEKGQSKTRIVEDALQAYLGDNVDDSTSNNVDNVDSNLHRENSIQQNVDSSTLSSENQTQQEMETLKAEMEGLKAEINSHREDLTVHWGIIHQTNKDIQRLQDTYPEFVEMTKINKQTLRDLKYETQKLKNSKASMNDIRNLENAIEQIDSDVQNRDRENIPSESPPKSTKDHKPEQLSFTEDKPPEEAKTDQSENESQNTDDEGSLTAKQLSKKTGCSEKTILQHSTPKHMDNNHCFIVQAGRGSSSKKYLVQLINYRARIPNPEKSFKIVEDLSQ